MVNIFLGSIVGLDLEFPNIAVLLSDVLIVENQTYKDIVANVSGVFQNEIIGIQLSLF